LPSLTSRDAQAKTFDHLLSLQTPRTDAPTTLPDPADSGFRCEDDSEKLTGQSTSGLTSADRDGRPIDPVLQAFLHAAFLLDYHHSNPLARSVILRRYRSISTKAEAVAYIQDVARRKPKPKKRLRKIRSMIKRSFRGRK
jgi:phospholipase C